MLLRVSSSVLISCDKSLSLLHKRFSNAGIWVGAWLMLGLALPTPAAQAQTAKSPNAVIAAPGGSKTDAAAPTKPLWSELTASQQTSLKPLETLWDTLGEAHKRRWLALSKNYSALSTAEQRTLHGRMSEWAALTGRQRVQARLNFAEVKQLAPNERKAKWEAYQALSEEDRRKLADKATVRPKSTAVPVRPVPAQKLVQVPPPPRKGEHGARIQLAPPVATGQRSAISGPGTPETAPENQASNPAVIVPPQPATTTPPTPPTPSQAPPVVPMIRMTEQPSSAP